jgi:adenine-specific DNA-methyltransferase
MDMQAKKLELMRQSLLASLNSQRTQAERNRLGQFATPPELASKIVNFARSMLSPQDAIRFLEPGFGTGAFYSALVSQVPGHRLATAVGYELDPFYAKCASKLWRETRVSLVVGDFTRTDPPQREMDRFNLVVCNPPYVRHHHLDQATKRDLQARIREHFGVSMNGLGGLYTYFLVLSQLWMSANGVGAWLIPSEFMDVNYGKPLKRFLLEHVTLRRIHRFDTSDVQFNDALVSSAVIVFRNALPPSGHKVEFSFGGSLADPKSLVQIDAAELRNMPKWTSLSSRSESTTTLDNGMSLADLFSIKRGVATGCNKFFVLTGERRSQLRVPKEFTTPILPSPRFLETNEITADANGEPQIRSRRYLLHCELSEAEIQHRHPALWDYLQSGYEAGIHERYICRHRTPWYAQETRPPAPFVCTYMGRATAQSDVPFRFILNESRATAANVYLMLYPKPHVQAAIKSRPSLARRIWQALCSITGQSLTNEGRVYGGGLYKMEPRELANVGAGPVLQALREEIGYKVDVQRELFSTTP